MALQFAFRVRDLHRRGLTVERIAQRLGTSPEEVMEAHRMLALPVNDSAESVRYRTDAEREAELERMPKRMQDRIRRTNT